MSSPYSPKNKQVKIHYKEKWQSIDFTLITVLYTTIIKIFLKANLKSGCRFIDEFANIQNKSDTSRKIRAFTLYC